jgi:hypothetical protein
MNLKVKILTFVFVFLFVGNFAYAFTPRVDFDACTNNNLFIEKVSIENKQDFPKDILFKDTDSGLAIEKNTPFGFYIVTKKTGNEMPAHEKVPIPDQYKPIVVLANGHYQKWTGSTPRGTEQLGVYEYGYFYPDVDGSMSLDHIDLIRDKSNQQTSANVADKLLPAPKDILIDLDTFYFNTWEYSQDPQHIVLKVKKSYSKNPDFVPCAVRVTPEDMGDGGNPAHSWKYRFNVWFSNLISKLKF